MLLTQGRRDEARHHFEVALDLAWVAAPRWTAIMQTMLAFIMLEEGDVVGATSGFAHVIRATSLTGYVGIAAPGILGLALCATSDERVERAAILHGCSMSLLEAWGGVWDSPEKEYRQRDLVTLRNRLGNEFERLYGEGMAMPVDQAVKIALSGH
jgi:hypothetical protein